MISIEISNRNISISQKDELIANCAGFDKLAFSFDSEWDGLVKSIVFTNGDVTIAVPVVSEEPIDIPPEVLRAGNLYVSAVGVADNGEKKLSTKKLLEPMNVKESGSQPDDEQHEYTPGFADQVLALLEERKNGPTFDDTPVEGSGKPVTSGGIYDALGERDTAIGGVRADLSAVQTRLTATEGNIADLTVDVTDVQTRLTATEGNISDLTADMSEAQTRLTATEGNISELTADMSAAKTRLTDAEGDISDLTLDVADAQTRLTTAEGDITTLIADVSDAQTRLTTAEGDISNLTADVSDAKTRLTIAEGELSNLTSDVTDTQTRLTAAEGDISALDVRISARNTVYGFRINSNESDPSAGVTYLADAVGMIPAAMDYVNNRFDYGSWEDAFFMPRPCMLKFDGTVDYYLDPDDYSKKADGTPSDITDDTYGGNAMMEWGQNSKRIWYKIIPEGDGTSASVYIADGQVDNDYRAWPFINNQGVLVKHFYTPIYNGSIDSAGRLRSLSGKANTNLCQSKLAAQEIDAAELNNPGTDKLWNTEVFCDVILIDLLLILMAKSLDTQTAYGKGRCGQSSGAQYMIGTGTMDGKGLFWGSYDTTYGVKVFGMENWWGNQWRRYSGYMMTSYVQKYKMTCGRQDGSTADGYNTTGDGYLIGATSPMENGYIKKMQFDENCFLPTEVGSDASHYWCGYWQQSDGIRYPVRGGYCSYAASAVGAFSNRLDYTTANKLWYIGAALSCKPLA